MSNNLLRVTPRSLITPADRALLRETVVELPAEETASRGRWRSVTELRQHLPRPGRTRGGRQVVGGRP